MEIWIFDPEQKLREALASRKRPGVETTWRARMVDGRDPTWSRWRWRKTKMQPCMAVSHREIHVFVEVLHM